jgi:hypothetical protein
LATTTEFGIPSLSASTSFLITLFAAFGELSMCFSAGLKEIQVVIEKRIRQLVELVASHEGEVLDLAQ